MDLLRRNYSKKKEKGEISSICTRDDAFWSGILNSNFLNESMNIFALCLLTFTFTNNLFFESKSDFCIYKKYAFAGTIRWHFWHMHVMWSSCDKSFK